MTDLEQAHGELNSSRQDPITESSANPTATEHLLSDTGKTSPLTDLSSPSPPYFKNESFDENTETNPTTRDSEKDSSTEPAKAEAVKEEPTIPSDAAEVRTKSFASYESSDLSDLDSEAETEKMFSSNTNPQKSQLSELAKIRRPQDEADGKRESSEDDTLIKEDVIDELQKQKDASDLDIDTNEEGISKVVGDLRKSEEAESSYNSTTTSTEATSSNGDSTTTNGKRKMLDDSEDVSSVKRRKSDDDSVDAHLRPGMENENEDDAEGDEDEGPEEEEEEEEEDEEMQLTEEQIKQKQLEVEAEQEKQRERKEAIQFLTEIEIDFAKLRDRLYEDKMGRFKSELEMCLDGTHPELQSVYSKIDAHREEKLKLSLLNQQYKLGCIDRQIRAQRTAVHQQFYRLTSDYKANYIREVMNRWDHITKEDQELNSKTPVFKYSIPEYVDDMVTQRTQMNTEISNLVGLSLYYGFPTAPKLSQADPDELDNDLRAMDIPVTKT